MTLNYHDRRKFPIVSTIMSIAFVLALGGVSFWVAVLDARLRTVTGLQTSVLESNIKFGEQCKGIKQELGQINKQLNDFLPCLIRRENDRRAVNN